MGKLSNPKKYVMLIGVYFIVSGIVVMITKNLGLKWEGIVPSGGTQAFILGVVFVLIGLLAILKGSRIKNSS
jgi:hypothetical protein